MADETCAVEDLLSTKLATLQNGNDLFVWNRNGYWNGNQTEDGMLKAQNQEEYPVKHISKEAALLLGYIPVTGKEAYYETVDKDEVVKTGSYTASVSTSGNIDISPNYTTRITQVEERRYTDVTVYAKVTPSGTGAEMKAKENAFLQKFNLYYDCTNLKAPNERLCKTFTVFGLLTAVFALVYLFSSFFTYGWFSFIPKSATVNLVSLLSLIPFTVFFVLFTVWFYQTRKQPFGTATVKMSIPLHWVFLGGVCACLLAFVRDLLGSDIFSSLLGTIIFLIYSPIALATIVYACYLGGKMVGLLFTNSLYQSLCVQYAQRKAVVKEFIDNGEKEKMDTLLQEILSYNLYTYNP